MNTPRPGEVIASGLMRLLGPMIAGGPVEQGPRPVGPLKHFNLPPNAAWLKRIHDYSSSLGQGVSSGEQDWIGYDMPVAATRDPGVNAMATPRTPLSLIRKILFSLVATFALLLMVEGVCRLIEPHFFPWKRSIPLPAPAAPGSEELREKLAEIRRKAPPALSNHIPIPLQEDPDRGWALTPNSRYVMDGISFRVNSQGLRGAEIPPLTPGEIRLFTLGDSSIYGSSVREDEVFSSVTAAILSRVWNRKVVGVIGAVPGHDSGQSLQTLRLVGEQVHPTWVIVGNLWSDVYRRDGAHSILEDLAYLPPVKQRLRGYATYRIMWQLLSPWLNSQKVRWIQSREDVGNLQDGPGTRVPIEEYVANLRAIVAESRKLGARVAFLVLPAPLDFDQVPPPTTVQAYRFAMRHLAEDIGAPLVDGPALFKEAQVPLTYFLDNVHPAPEGHRLLGEALAQALMEVGPPPQGKSVY